MKRILYILSLCFVLALSASAQQAKYVFYFIGDGMGTTHVNGTETWLSALKGEIGTTPLCFASFPQSAYVTTYSARNGVTDSAAAGTALATGKKTYNGAIGVGPDTVAVQSVAAWAKRAGAYVGVTTSVTIDHATPASFYAHQPYRKMAYEIGEDLVKSDFDFFGGSGFTDGKRTNSEGRNLYAQVAQAGYSVVEGFDAYKSHRHDKKVCLFQTESARQRGNLYLPFAIDRGASDLTLTQITRAAVDFLYGKAKKHGQFFLMAEGGRIDMAAHSNDVGTMFAEVVDMDEAIKVAYQFYLNHPQETLIVVTADHETGGLVLGTGHYSQHSDVLQYQTMSAETYSRHLSELRMKLGESYDWAHVMQDLTDNWGFWDKVVLTENQEQRLRRAFDDVMAGIAKESRSLYATEGALASTAKNIMAECAEIGWQSGSHSNSYVPLFAIGAGAELFHGRIDNTEISQKIAKAAGWKTF